jgi:hypothetical protein
MVMFKYKSKIGQGGNKQYTALRCFIPKEVTKFLNVSETDYLEWIVNVDEKGVNVQVQKKD